jgi:hypothetical protein
MNKFQSLDPRTLIGKTVLFRGAGEIVEVDRFERGEFHGINLLTNGHGTLVDAEFIQDGIIVMEPEEARRFSRLPSP